MQIRYKILLKRVSVTGSGPDHIFIYFLIVLGIRRDSKVFKVYRKNAVILNSRVVHSQDATMQTVFRKTCRNTSKIEQNLIRNRAQTVPDAIWKDLEGSGGQNWILEGLGGQILDSSNLRPGAGAQELRE